MSATTNARHRLLQSARVLDLLAGNVAQEREHVNRLRASMNCDPLPEVDDPIGELAARCREAAAGLEHT